MSAVSSSLSARDVHTRLVRAVADVERAEKNLVAWFRVMLERRLYRSLGYSSIHPYASEELGFSTAKTAQLIRTCRSLDKLPALRKAVEAGDIPWTKARTLTPVATPETEEAWLNQAKRAGRRDLEQTVRRARRAAVTPNTPMLPLEDPGSGSATSTGSPVGVSGRPPGNPVPLEVPVTISLRMTPTQYARYEKLLRSLGAGSDRAEVILQALATVARRNEAVDPETSGSPRDDSGKADENVRNRGAGNGARSDAGNGAASGAGNGAGNGAGSGTGSPSRASSGGEPPYRIVLYRCEVCGRGHTPTLRGDLAVAPAVLRQATCDSRQERNGRNTASLPPSLRRRILDRDGHRCRSAGCNHTGFLEVHHVVPRHRGGGNDPDNLITLCSACHRVTHEHGDGRTEADPGSREYPGTRRISGSPG